MITPHPPTPAASARGVRKAVVPAAGLGTRFLPARKATPKEMLPVVDKPAIQHVVEEAAAAGLDDVHPPGRGSEIQLTDALQELAAGGTVHGVVFNGLRYDTGDKADYLRTAVRLACERPGLGPEFVAWLRGFLGELDGARPGHRNVAA
ncbi:sugar phosphate nucleotidyltransferase [Streptomyces massasporeus]|uniref:sugar phosphate nucleotidyltransferase n=1 Tax=Streptomyces massasporeus TaxID=67324 RepID=UPI0034060A4D